MAKVPSHPVQGDSDMTDRDITNRTSSTRRDLKFAGTIAAGLCAGVLGVGAIAVPLVGWNDWPHALPVSDGDPITLTDAAAGLGGPRDGDGPVRYTPRPTAPVPASAVALLTSTGAATATDGAGTTGTTGAS